MPSRSKVWFITGTSRGFGRIWATAALKRGDTVAATARNTSTLTDLAETYGGSLLPIELDVTDEPAVDAAVGRARDHFGRLDVVINNAGYGVFGMIGEVSEQHAHARRSHSRRNRETSPHSRRPPPSGLGAATSPVGTHGAHASPATS